MRNLTTQFSNRFSVKSRMMSRIIPVVIGIFLLLGILGAVVVRSSAQETLKGEHTRALISIEEQVNNLLTQVIADTRRIAADDTTRQFARNTLAINPQGVSSSSLVPMFESLIASNLNQYLAVRYVTFTGAVWTEVSSIGTLTTTTTRIRPNELNDDPALIEALASMPGDVVVGGVSFRVNPDAPSTDRLVPFLRFASPVFNELDSSNIVGVIQIDIAADPIFSYVQAEGTALAASQAGRRLIIIDGTNRVLLDSDAPETNFFRNLANRIPSVLSQQNASIGEAVSLLAPNEEVELAEIDETLYSIVSLQLSPNSELAWRFILIDSQGLTNYLSFSNGVLILSLVFGIVTCFLINEILKRTLRPVEALREVSKTALRTSGIVEQSMFDKRISEIDLPAPTNNEFDQLVEAFEKLGARSKVLLQETESQRGRYNRNLDIAGRIGREAATLDDINLLLKRTVDLICNEFGYVQANVFRVDDAGFNAILVYGRGDLGQELLAKKYRILVGSRNTIGVATANGSRIILNDLEKQISAYPAPYEGVLDRSRSQMILPLQISKRVIGALDIQSDVVNGFSEEDARILNILADQIAVAMENMHLLQEAEDRVRQIDNLNQQMTNVGWEDPEAREGIQNSYTYDLLDVQRTTEAIDKSEPSISIPILIRGQVIGSLSADAPEDLNFSSGDEALIRAVADRVGIAIENARLFESTHASLSETSTLYQLVRALNEATSLEDVLQSIAVSVMPDAISAQIGVFDEYSGSMPFLLEILADWNIYENDDRSVELTGLQIHVPEHPILTGLQPNQVLLVNDTENDARLDTLFRAIVETTGGKSLVIIPFSVRGVWRGIFMAQFAGTRSFGEREGRIFTALTDQAGVVIDNRMLLRQNEVALEQVERLYTSSRSINMAQNPLDLVQAASSTEDETGRTFELGIFEGKLDETGWPSQIRVVAAGRKGEVKEEDLLFDISIAKDSPLRYREPQITIVREEGESSSLAQYARSRGFRFVASFPLYSANMPIALFFVTSEHMREELSSEDYEVYRALTGQMSTVLQNTRLLAQTQESLDETRRLYEASQDITNALDTTAIYEASLRNLMSANEAISRVSILLSSTASHDAPHVEYSYAKQAEGVSDSKLKIGTQIKREAIPFGAMLTNARAIFYNSLDEVDQPELRKLLERNKSRSAAVISLQIRQQWYGLLLVESKRANTFDDSFMRFSQALADQSSTAIESLKLFQEAQLQAQRALALAEAGQLSNRIGQKMEENIAEVFRGVAAPAQYDRWLLMLYNESKHTLDRVVEYSPARGAVDIGEAGDGMPLSTIGIPLADAFNQQQAILVNNPREYPNFPTKLEGVDDFAEYVGKHLAVPIISNDVVIGALAVGRALSDPDLGEADTQLGTTLAAQVAVAVENRNLFMAAENERENLSSVLSTLPAGVLVLDAETLRPVQSNLQARQLLGREIDFDEPFSIEGYNLYTADTTMHYPERDLPIYITKETGELASSDNLVVRRADGLNIALLVNAAPIKDPVTKAVTSIVVAFQDISPLRGLETALQNNLNESITLYQTSRSLSEGRTLDELLDRILERINTVEADNGFVILLEEQGIRVARAMNNLADGYQLPGEIMHPTEVILISDLNHDRKLDDAVRLALTNKNIYALASLPMRSRSRGDEENTAPIGWIILTYDTPQVDLLTRENFLNTLTDTSAVAIDNRNLFRSTQNALQEANNLYQATTAISRVSSDFQLAETLRNTIATLKPDLYAGYIFNKTEPMTELFNENLDDAPIDFKSMIERHSLRNLATLYIDDIRAITSPSAFEQELIDLGNIRAVALVQIGSSYQTMGMLILGYHRPRHFDDSIGRYLSAISDSTSVIVDNIQLLSQIQNNLEETTALYQASRELADATTPAEILKTAITHLMDTPLDVGFMVLLNSRTWDQADALVRVAAGWTDKPEEFADLTNVIWSANEFPSWRLLSTSEIVTINTQDEGTNLDFMEKTGLESMGLQSAAFIPLRASGRPIGTLVLGSRVPMRSQERNSRVFRAFSEQASLRLEAAHLLEQAERRARQLSTSAEVSSFASSILDLEFLLPRIVDLIRDAFKYDHVQIFLMDHEGEFAELRASTGDAGRQLLDIKHKLKRGSSSVIGQVTETGKPTVAFDTADARVIHRPNPYLPKTRSEMAIPLQLKGQVVGALDVQSNQPNAYDDDDIAVLTTLAAQISVAIDNAQLYEAAQNRASETSFLFNVTSNAAGAETLRDALENVALELQAETEALAVGIYLHVEYEEEDETFLMLQPIAAVGTESQLSEVPAINLETEGEKLLASIANNRRAEIITDISQIQTYTPLNETAQSAIIVPLVTGTQFVGLIAVESNEINAFNHDNLTLMLTLSGSLSAIVQSQQLLEQVQRQNDQLRELDRLKSDFLANMSHELRTPLNSIIGFSRVILKGIDGPLTEMQEQDLTTIYNSGLHLLNLINDILDQAKIAAGKMDLQFDYFEMKQVIDGVRSIGIGLVKDKSIDIHVNIASGLKKAYGDEFRTRQVLLNLVSNAAKFTKEGSITLDAYPIVNESGQTMLRVDVTDTGIGIAEKDLSLLFEAFRQVDSSLTRTQGGTGLGLVIAKSLIEMQGGEMLVQSIVNTGSTFSITMPTDPALELTDTGSLVAKSTTGKLAKTAKLGLSHGGGNTEKNSNETEERPARLINETNEAPMLARPPMHVKRQILVIEDNPDMVDQFRRILQREGFDIFAASIPLEAEAMASGLHPTIIIMDVNFAEGQGWEILTRLKQRDDTRDIPVVVVTLSQEEERADELGVFKFVKRPFMPEQLAEAVLAAEQESRIDRILIIDDQPESIRVLEDLLAEQGHYKVFSASSAMDGMSMVARRRPNLVIVDLRMPEMDGFDLIGELRANPETATIPIIVVTGDTINEDEQTKLNKVPVMFKADIHAGQRTQFIEGVKTRLTRPNGGA